MKLLICLLTGFCLLPSIVNADEIQKRSAVGRYQVVLSMEGLYFLDTATGELWRKGGERWERVDSPVSPRPRRSEAEKNISLELVKGSVTVPLMQRESRAVPGSSGTLIVQVGDITGGQVFVELLNQNGHEVMPRASLKEGEFVQFRVNEQVVYLQLIEMVNHLFSEDFCKVRFSVDRPPTSDRATVATSEPATKQRDDKPLRGPADKTPKDEQN
ncbi:MAG: hypothetical protein AAGG48_10670 [Planctomycetota bacterium]